ncbi:MAG: hypothetical protein A2W95_03605 [Bacteroidetes bacterium GWA2_40_14]|nr:MAG: hypothetical protein A2W95_03605 [Bacteroidetes bacterium GWA2_40_14]
MNNRLMLRKWQNGDEPYLAYAANNINIWKSVMDIFPHPYTFDDARNWVELNQNNENLLNFAIVFDGDPVGNVGITLGNDVHKKSAALGYWLAEPYWGKGIMTQSVKWMVDYAFRNFDLNRIWAGVFSNNPASMKVLLNSGFKQEAVLQKAVVKDGQELDEYIFSMLK